MSDINILIEAEQFVYQLFKEKFKSENIYHNINHTVEVVNVAKKIGKASDLNDEDLEIVLLSSWLHDVGYTESSDKHEEISVRIAQSFLSAKKYPDEKIAKVTSAIMATKIPQNPKNKIDEVICDADLHHLGRNDFFDKSKLFRVELETRFGKTFSDTEWLKNTIEFVTSHFFHTEYAIKEYTETKRLNLLKLQKRFRKKQKKAEEEKLRDDKLSFEKEKLAKKKEQEKKSDRGIETMFRNVMRTHIALSAIADNKANIMITVNTLLLGAIATILARKLDANPHLIIPTIALSIVSLTTLIYGVLVTRPSVSSGTFTKEDIKKKSTNLLFFGNFHNMNLDDFTWGMTEMMNDRDYLYGSMIKDFYFLGQVLGKKYKNLRVCYSIFMYGMVVAILLFIIFIVMNPEKATDLGNILE